MAAQSRGFLASPEGVRLLQAAKAERGWTFAAIAQRAGVSADTVSRLFHPERGKRVSREEGPGLLAGDDPSEALLGKGFALSSANQAKP